LHHVAADIRLLIKKQEPSLFVNRLQPACCDHLHSHQHQSISRHSLVRRYTFQGDYQSRAKGRPSPAGACTPSEPRQPAHWSHRSAPIGSAQFAWWLRSAGQPSRSVYGRAHRRPLRLL